MATLTIRGLDPVAHARLRVEAARHGRSVEAEPNLAQSPGRWRHQAHVDNVES